MINIEHNLYYVFYFTVLAVEAGVIAWAQD